jgi:hypothetical protein
MNLLELIDALVIKHQFGSRDDLLAEAVSFYAVALEEAAAGLRFGTMDPKTRSFVHITFPGTKRAEEQVALPK